IHENYDLLLEYDLRITGEVTLRIIHSLAGLPGSETENIKRIFSVPQVSRECRQFLDLHPEWELIPAKNTTAAALILKQENNPDSAAITSREFAEANGLQVMEEGIETNPRNFNRYIVIASDPVKKDKMSKKSSLVFSSVNKPGALLDCLQVFSDKGINMVKLESRPIHGKPWEYMFYVDFEADAESESFAPVMDSLKKKTDFIKILGTY
ncbi:prephenate dehydratase domain-containing protein, partial [Desulfobacterales bacterium HSG17]|nr:prephenate dehydratase domain-containing protein [Desulfobacterales bacterium HSG17]